MHFPKWKTDFNIQGGCMMLEVHSNVYIYYIWIRAKSICQIIEKTMTNIDFHSVQYDQFHIPFHVK